MKLCFSMIKSSVVGHVNYSTPAFFLFLIIGRKFKVLFLNKQIYFYFFFKINKKTTKITLWNAPTTISDTRFVPSKRDKFCVFCILMVNS
jgi:hypothetical protein